MAQSKLNDLAGKFGKGGGPPGLALGIKVLGTVGALAYGISQSMFTGNIILYVQLLRKPNYGKSSTNTLVRLCLFHHRILVFN